MSYNFYIRILVIILLEGGETQKTSSKEKDVRMSNIVAAKGL